MPQSRDVPVTHPDIQWNLVPAVLLPLAAYACLYAWRFRQARREAGGRGAGFLQALAFVLAVLVLLALLIWRG